MAAEPPALVPRPRRLEWTGEGLVAGAVVAERPVGGLRPEGYELDLTPDGGELRYSDDAGLRHGRRTVTQLRTGRHGARIRDWPDFAVRAFMLDISRNRVPTRDTLDRLVGVMGIARLNQLQLYTEHTFAYTEHEDVWRDASPLTADDMRWLDRRCREEGIELVANQNCFGHMERWLKLPAYRMRAETPDGYEPVPGIRRPPSVLAPSDDNARFVLGLLEELLPTVASRRVNIGCDETFELGLGVSAGSVAARGKTAVYAEHLRRLVEPLVAGGHQVLFWDDVARRDPGVLDGLPDDAIALVWNYEAPGPAIDPGPGLAAILDGLGVDLDPSGGFGRLTRQWAGSGRRFWVAPGTSSWNSLVGRLDNAIANMADAASAGLADGAEGYLITDWGDGGHLQPPSVSFGPMLFGGAVSWCLDANRDLDVAGAVDRLVFEGGGLGAVLDDVGRLWSRTGQRAFNGSPLDAALSPGGTGMVVGRPDAAAVAEVVGALDDALDRVGRAAVACADAATVRAELAFAVGLARVGGWRLLEQAGGSAPAWQPELRSLSEVFDVVWLARSRPGGMAESMERLSG